MKRAFIFPGQGSQAVGMGKALAEAFPQAKAVFDEVDEALAQKLSAIIWKGPPRTLTLTANAQPALMAVSLAAIRVLEAEAGLDLKKHAAFVAGHSLGEYSALAAAGSLSHRRYGPAPAHPRQRHAERRSGRGRAPWRRFSASNSRPPSKSPREAAQGEVCDAANDNGGGQVVVSGHKAAVERAVAIAQAKGAKRAVMLPVSAPFHCALMAARGRGHARGARAGVTSRRPPCRWSPTWRRARSPIRTRSATRLVRQVTGTVRWRESVACMAGAGRRSTLSRSAPARS